MLNKNYLSIYAKSFNWAGFFLPKEVYTKCSALYDFCRIADNIADDQNILEIKKSKFDEFEENFKRKNFNDPVIKNMWSIINEFNISLKIVQDLLDGVKSDIQTEVRINSRKDLLIYSYRVAGTVGLMMAKILKVKKKDSLYSAIELGIAMQLTNISRDVVEDALNNRYYVKGNFENIKSIIYLADNFYDNSFYSIRDIPIRLRFSILVARRIYRKIGYKILKIKTFEEYKSYRKIYVNNFEKIIETFFSFLDLFKLSFISTRSPKIVNNLVLIKEEINLDERI